MSKVYLLRIKEQSPKTLIKAGKRIFELFSDFFTAEDKIAVKLHFGERGSKTYLSPVLVKAIYEKLTEKVKEVILVDCTVVYKGERSLGSSHKKLAVDQGFGFAPILIADGEKGEEEIKIEVNQKHFKEVKIGAGIKNFNSILSIAHFTGHRVAAFGGALKNIGMGFGSKGGKLEMHKAFNLRVNPEICIGCGICQKDCPAGAIFIKNGKAFINYKKCIGCGRCVSSCPNGAIEIPLLKTPSKDLQEGFVEYAFGILKRKKAFFLNVLLNITAICDCVKEKDERPIVPDIGILASEDIVAIDRASLDLISEEHFYKPNMNPNWQIDYAYQIGLGEKEYNLIEIK